MLLLIYRIIIKQREMLCNPKLGCF